MLRRLQKGELIGLPQSHPMSNVGASCHELRIVDGKLNWRIMYHIAADAVVILDVFKKQTEATPNSIVAACQRRLADFMRLTKKKKRESGHAKR